MKNSPSILSHDNDENLNSFYSVNAMAKLCNVDNSTIRRCISRLHIDAQAKIGSSHTNVYSEESFEKIRNQLARNQLNQGINSDTGKAAVKELFETSIANILNNPAALMQLVAQSSQKLIELEQENQKLLPDAESWRAFAEKSGNYCVTNVGRLLNVSPKLIFNYLETKGFICRDQRTGKYIGTMEGVSRGFIANEIWKNDNKSGIQMRLTPEGMKKIADAFGKTESAIKETADKWAETNYLNPNAEPCSLKRE